MIKTECERCQSSFAVAPGVAITLLCQSCGSNKLTLSKGQKKSLLALCRKCNGTFEIPCGVATDIEHSGCGSSILTLEPEQEEVATVDVSYTPKDDRGREIVVSVVIVCHNLLPLTKRCVDAVRKFQTPHRIILVDNGSTDDTRDWAEKQESLVYVRNQVNLGCGIGRNQGSAWAVGDWLLFLDNDQIPPPDLIEKMTDVGTDLVGVEVWNVASDGIVAAAKVNVIGKHSYIGAGGMLVRLSAFRALGGFDERYAPAWYEDADFVFRAKVANYTIGHLAESGVEHIGSQTIKSQKTFDLSEAKSASRKVFMDVWQEHLFGNRPPRRPKLSMSKPRVVMVVDEVGWAWDYKARQVQKWLSDEFCVEIVYAKPDGLGIVAGYDLYFTFDWTYGPTLARFPFPKRITGVTAHTYTNDRAHAEKLKMASAVHANSRLLFNELKHIHSNCYYLPNGVDPMQFAYSEREISQPFIAAYVGKDTPRKGLSDFIIPACRRAGVELRAQVCKFRDPCKIDHSDMPKFYANVDVVLIASTMDGTPNQLLEAASVGRTFIGNRIGNVPEFCTDGVNGFLVDRAVPAYVEKLSRLKEDRKRCREMGIEARRTVDREWTWQIQAENYRRMFWNVLEGSGD